MRPPSPRRLVRRLAGERLEERAACARALSAHLGRPAAIEELPGGAAQVTRAALTARVIAAQDPVPWPAAVMRQLDPADPAFLPPLGLHLVLAARDRTWVGLPGGGRLAWVDPYGWAGLGEGPSVAVWFADGRRAFPVGRRPDESGVEVELEQERSDEVLGVITRCRRDHLTLELHFWAVLLEGRVAWALHARLRHDAPAPRPVRLAFALRPAGMDGAAPIFHLRRDGYGLWTADDLPLLALARPGDEVLLGRRGEPDPWHRFSGAVVGEVPLRPGPAEVRCPAGMASGLEVYRTTLMPGETFGRLAVLAPPPSTPAALVRTSGRTLWDGARADRSGLLSAGAEFELARHDEVLRAARLRLLSAPPRPDLAGILGAVALARLGFQARAADRLERWLGMLRRGGTLPGAEPEAPAVLAWAAAVCARWTGDAGWVRANARPWARLLDHLAEHELPRGGRFLIGPDGSGRWSAIWRAAALLSGTAALRHLERRRTAWALAGGRLRERLRGLLGRPPWSAASDRAPDGSGTAMLAAAWLDLLPADDPGVRATAEHVRARHWHGGGVLLHGGAHVAATALWMAVHLRAEGTAAAAREAIDAVARLASPTGALPTARHPARGALFEGDDLLSAALFALLCLDLVQVGRGRLRVLAGIRRARDLPTPYGRLDLDLDDEGRPRVRVRWRDEEPHVEIVEEEPR